MKTYGRASSGSCPKGGYVWLQVKTNNQQLVVPTTCKAWGCLACRDRVKNLVKMRIQYGCLILGSCYFITLTYRVGRGSRQRTAAIVAADWRELLKRLKTQLPNLAWFRVVEATKKKQPHLHLVIGGIGSHLPSCRKIYEPINFTFLTKDCPQRCLLHVFAKAWYSITGDSYVVDARVVLGAGGAAAYMAKYLIKALASYSVLENLGFKRRWSRSNNWPSSELQLAGTEMDAFKKSGWTWKGGGSSVIAADREEHSRGHALLERVGNEMYLELSKLIQRKSAMARLKGLIHETVPTTNEQATSSPGHGRSGSGSTAP